MNLKGRVLVFFIGCSLACNTGQKTVIRRDAGPASMPKEKQDLFKADFRYSPPWWQTAVGLPDDPQETFVSKEGALLYDYPGEFSGFGTRVAVALDGAANAVSTQSMENARVPIVETVLSDEGGKELARWSALAVAPGEGQNLPAAKKFKDLKYDRPPRGDLLLIKKSSKAFPISLTIHSQQPLDMTDLVIFRGRQRFLSISSAWKSLSQKKDGLKIIFSERVEELAVYCASGHEAENVSLDWAKTQPERAARYWNAQNFPYDSIRLPDPVLQGLLDACIRDIFRARETDDGFAIVEAGPTDYRSSGITDEAFILEAMTLLGRGREARAGIHRLLTRQKPDGSFETLANDWKENGLVLYILCRQALLTQDNAWLKQNWDTMKRVVRAIQGLRMRSRSNPAAPEAGLMPPGLPEAGTGGAAPEYANVYWNLAGLKAAVEAARLIQAPELAEWEAEFKSFFRAFQAAVKRDAAATDNGLLNLSIMMKPQKGIDIVRGQGAFCHGLYPGKLFGPNDPLALGNMQLLCKHEKEGVVLGTGWRASVIRNSFASLYGHAYLWLGAGHKAAEILYAFANHASPLGAWREEQAPQGEEKGEIFAGGMPHKDASAEFIRLTRNLLVLERGADLHLLEGIPRTWLAPGMTTELKNIATDFGPVAMKLEVAPDGKTARLSVTPPEVRTLKRIVIHLGAWAAEGKAAPRKIQRAWDLTIPLVR